MPDGASLQLPAIESAFSSLGLTPALLDAVARAGYETPTPIQRDAIPPALAGKDVIGCAATGTGKTAAFVLPMVMRLAGKTGTHGLILAPTRELVQQIALQLEQFGRPQKVRGAVLVGGVAMGPQVQALRDRPTVVVATPGRLIDHLERGTIRLDHVEILVLDEADRMLDMGFRAQLDSILRRVPVKRQTMLFSATMAGEVAGFAKKHLHAPVKVEVAKSGTLAERVEQQAYIVDQADKTALLLALIDQTEESVLVFTRTQHRAEKLAKALNRTGLRVARIHGGRSQGQREAALRGFRDRSMQVLVATNVAARGLDIDEIGLVVNYDLSASPEDYVHRVGRTGRAEASGRASAFVAPEELKVLREVERFTRSAIPRATVPADLARWRKVLAESEAAARAAHGAHGSHGRGSRRPAQPQRHRASHPSNENTRVGRPNGRRNHRNEHKRR